MSKKKNEVSKIKKIETDYPIYCPFCDQIIRDEDEEGEFFYEPNVCPHLLFSACDDGFEFRSERFNEHMNIESKEDDEDFDDFHPDGINIDAFTDKVTIPGSVKYAIYEGLGDSLGAYYGFAPLE